MQNRLELIRTATRPVRSRIFDSARWDEFPVRADDIVIATYPKCGTTWMQRIVGMLVFGSAEPFPMHDVSPWPDFRLIPPEAILQLSAGQSHRRFLKSHLPFDALPHYRGVKYIHVARDGRDAAMSFYNHKANYTPETAGKMLGISRDDPKFGDSFAFVPSDPSDHFHNWLVGDEDALGDPGASYFGIENSFWAARQEPDVLLVHFNDLKADREGEMRRIAEFLDIEIAGALWPELVEAAGFDAMKNASEVLMPRAAYAWKGGGKTFLNKGTNGRWHDVYSAEDLALYDERVTDEFSPALAAWCEHGRLVAGDPRTAPD
jgi:aryl sulfotransferase